MNKAVLILIAVLMLVPLAFAESSDTENESNITITGSGNIMFGQIASGYAFKTFGNQYFEKTWQNFYSGRINIISKPTEWFTTIISPEISSAFPVTTTSSIMKETYKLAYRAGLPKAVGIFNFDLGYMTLNIESGVMEYTFNPDVKNLGNYMYRSSSYPLVLKTNLDYPYANIVGIHPEIGLLNNTLKLGSIINSITTQAPFNDFSLGFFASYSPESKFIDVGFGICADRLISVNDRATDVVNDKANLGDTTLTLRSTKIDFRINLDPKKLLGEGIEDMLGKEDGKVYFEAAMLGTKDPTLCFPVDSILPKSIFRRVPLLFGVNIPTFKVLDYLSFEVEFLDYPYANDWWGAIVGAPTPKPSRPSNSDTTWVENYRTKDNWKWSVQLKKSISKFDFIAFVANDHKFYDTFNAEIQGVTEQTLRTPKDWHWYIKLQYNL